MDKIKVFALSGLDEIGRDCYVVEINDDIFVVECGAVVPDKTMPGIDLLIPNFSYIIENKNRLKGYFITHGHSGCMSALKFYYNNAPAPIFLSYTTMMALNGQAFLHHMNTTKFDFRIVSPNDDINVAGHNIRLFQTLHNVANSFGVCFETDRGNVVYTSDFIIDFSLEYNQYLFGHEKISKISEKNTLLLMTPSSSAERLGYCSPRHHISDKIEDCFTKNKRIFFACFWEDSLGLTEFINLSQKYKKKIYCYDEYTRVVFSDILKSDVGIRINENDLVKKEDFVRVPPSSMVILFLGQGIEIYEEIAYLALKQNADNRIIVSEKDIFVCIASPSPMFEVAATRAMDDIYRSGAEICWFSSKNHSSAHARKDDLKTMISLFMPAYYFPVRGLYTSMLANARLAIEMNSGLNFSNIFVLDNGMQILFDGPGKPRLISTAENKIDVTPGIVTGTSLSQDSKEIISDRLKIGNDGVVVIAASVSRQGKAIVTGPDCQMRGFVFARDAEPLLKTMTQIFVDEVNTAMSLNKFDFEEAKTNIVERAHRFLKRENGREPLIYPIIEILD